MKKFLTITIIIIFVSGILGFALAWNLNYSDGFRSGTIVKMSSKGAVFKTNEGQLLSGGLATGDGGDLASNLWEFSVEKSESEVLKEIELAVDGRYPVKLRYKEKWVSFFWRGDTKYFVYHVERVGSSE